MYSREHPPPHFHATYGEHEALVSIDTFTIAEGYLPRRVERMVLEWTRSRRAELDRAWSLASTMQNPGKIAPLD